LNNIVSLSGSNRYFGAEWPDFRQAGPSTNLTCYDRNGSVAVIPQHERMSVITGGGPKTGRSGNHNKADFGPHNLSQTGECLLMTHILLFAPTQHTCGYERVFIHKHRLKYTVFDRLRGSLHPTIHRRLESVWQPRKSAVFSLHPPTRFCVRRRWLVAPSPASQLNISSADEGRTQAPISCKNYAVYILA